MELFISLHVTIKILINPEGHKGVGTTRAATAYVYCICVYIL
jgi:hypothetical protein